MDKKPLVLLQPDKQTLELICPNCESVWYFKDTKTGARRAITQYKRNGRGHYCSKPECRQAGQAESVVHNHRQETRRLCNRLCRINPRIRSLK